MQGEIEMTDLDVEIVEEIDCESSVESHRQSLEYERSVSLFKVRSVCTGLVALDGEVGMLSLHRKTSAHDVHGNQRHVDHEPTVQSRNEGTAETDAGPDPVP